MFYKREFIIQASHFNNGLTYTNYHRAVQERDFKLLHEVLRDQHGHNFKIIIEAENDTSLSLFVVDDELLEAMVMQWNNTNLTLHENFNHELREGYRITLELMVSKLYNKIIAKTGIKNLKLTIYETETISASIGFQ